MEMNVNEIEINGTIYVPKPEAGEIAARLDGLEYVMVRTYSAGVFAGYLKDTVVEGGVRTSTLIDAIRIHYWDGAASLSQLSAEGTNKPDNCRFAMPVQNIQLTNVVETIEITAAAKISILGVESWKM